ncbi:MAG: dockerin type I repeat-containing protein [Oscillospiraceae bacterium]|nr:dockerin type I repeat-containing protein [Oscillospiraceae bacterium]
MKNNVKMKSAVITLAFGLAVSGTGNVLIAAETERVIPWYEVYASETSISEVLDGLDENYMLIPASRLNPDTKDIYPASNASVVITETDLKDITELSYKYKVYYDSPVQVNKINEALAKYNIELSQSDETENVYETNDIHDLKLKKEISEQLAKADHVKGIEELSEVSVVSEGFVAYIYTESDLEKDQIIEKYSKYGLEISHVKENTADDTKYIYYFKFKQFIGKGISDLEYQKNLNELLDDSDIRIDFAFNAEISDSKEYSKNIYQACSSDSNFDINSDGKRDVTDLSMLSLYLIGDLTLTDTQLKASDVDGDGAVTLADLARFKQFLSGVVK